MHYLAPSVLAADFACLGSEVKTVGEAGAQMIHLDVIDGSFAPNITLGIPVIASLRSWTDRIFDVHLMINDPDRYIGEFVKAGADIITVHAEACRHLDRTIGLIKELGAKAAVSLNPATPISQIEWILEQLDMVLLMSVNPGFGGQSMIPYVLKKARMMRDMLDQRGLSHVDIEMDGGITLENAKEVMDAGVNVLVAGSSVFKGDRKENVRAFLELFASYEAAAHKAGKGQV